EVILSPRGDLVLVVVTSFAWCLQDYNLQRPSQELVAKDLHGTEWRFR
uniref:Uncharacterized protein n=1 Tax=Aegilops tauschii subsp. strangulata TaxID=200361 RepID=A0A453F7F3_AEGTS